MLPYIITVDSLNKKLYIINICLIVTLSFRLIRYKKFMEDF